MIPTKEVDLLEYVDIGGELPKSRVRASQGMQVEDDPISRKVWLSFNGRRIWIPYEQVKWAEPEPEKAAEVVPLPAKTGKRNVK